ncbi:MAG: PfkB family carbohydrate kinase [Candidatus Berkiella sp.]
MKKSNKLFDIVVLGPSHVQLQGEQQGSTLKSMLSFQKSIGKGAPSIAIGLARLALKSALISSVGEDAMGQFILETLQDEGVDVSQTNTAKDYLTPLVMQNNDADQMITYASLAPSDSTTKELNENFINKSRALLILSTWLQNASNISNLLETIQKAKEHQVKIILQVNQLPKRNEKDPFDMSSLFALCDVIIGEELDYLQLSNAENIDSALTSFSQLTTALLVVKGKQACYVPSVCQHRGFSEVNKVDIHACTTGFLAAWLHEKTLEQCAEAANACETHTELNGSSPSLDTLNFFISHQNKVFARIIQSPFFANLCYSSVQKRLKKPLFLINLGNNELWRKMAEPYGAKEETVNLAKQYVSEAISQAFEKSPAAGIILEDETTFSYKPWSTKLSWLARSLEKPGEVPLQFIHDSELTSILTHWPKHHVAKVSVTYHPDDRYSLRGQQESLLAQLHSVCRNTKNALLIDLIMPMNSLITAKTHAHIMQRFYELGIYPDYWQMSLPRDQRTWENIYTTIQDGAPFCQGIFINAISASLDQLPTLIEIAGKEKLCLGLVTGRALFQNTVEQWFAKKIDDPMLVESLSDNLRNMAALWNEKCQSESLIDHLMPRSWQMYS